MKLILKGGEIVDMTMGAETFYFLYKGQKDAGRGNVTIQLKVWRKNGAKMTINMAEIDADKTFELIFTEGYRPDDCYESDYRIRAAYGM